MADAVEEPTHANEARKRIEIGMGQEESGGDKSAAANRASESSQQIVSFIASLQPLYTPEWAENQHCARSLRDGTLVMPMAESREDEDGWVEVRWRGGSADAVAIRGIVLARIALSDYVQFVSRGKPERYAAKFEQLAEHFELKTGRSLSSQDDPLVQLIEAASNGVRKLGIVGLIAVIKKAVGF